MDIGVDYIIKCIIYKVTEELGNKFNKPTPHQYKILENIANEIVSDLESDIDDMVNNSIGEQMDYIAEILGFKRRIFNLSSQIDGFRDYYRNPKLISAIQINEPFSVETIGGTIECNAGDYLIRDDEGELGSWDKKTFNRMHVEVKKK